MDKTIVNVRIQNKYDTDKNWKISNPILLKGEQVVAIDDNNRIRIKTGNGTVAYSRLPFDDEYLFEQINDLKSSLEDVQEVVNGLSTYVESLQNGEELLTQPMLIAKIQDSDDEVAK